MMMEYITLLTITIVLGLVIVFLYIRDKEMTKLILSLKNEIFNLKKNYKDNGDDKSQSYKKLDDKIYEIGESLIKIVRNLKNIDAKQNIHEEKIKKIEEQLKPYALSSSSNTNENKILSLFKDGKSIEEIASQERIPVGEVELIVKLSNLHAE